MSVAMRFATLSVSFDYLLQPQISVTGKKCMSNEDPPNENPVLLLVDDDEIYCEVLGDALTKRNFEVSTAHNLTTALQLARDIEPEYAVIDLRIGTESGLELVKQLAALDENTRIIMLTGYASVATAVESIKLGAVHYLTKPATADEVVAALDRDEGDASVEPSERPLSVKRLEWEHLQKVLTEHDGNISAAARALNMHRRTLQRKLAKHPVKE
jgi:two-component system response regulator RegA